MNLLVLSMARAKRGRSVGREAASRPILNSMEFQRKYELFRKWSGSAKIFVCKIVLYMEAAQALWIDDVCQH